MTASVLTLVRGRAQHLRHLMQGLARQTLAPLELVIAWMQDQPHEALPDPGCPVRHVFVPGDPMPLARARNRAAEAARGETLVFLDVDCIPSAGLVAAYEAATRAADGLFLGEVYYLPKDAAAGGIAESRLDAFGRPHHSKPPVPAHGVREEPDHGELWGLSFALRRERWTAVGGMDERFHGYGGEETDFAARLSSAGVRFYWTGGARAYHQHHPVLVPPLHNFAHILRNAALFRARHGRWCMDYWLGQFRDAGLVDWHPAAEAIRVLREPDAAEIEAARRDDLLFS